MELDGKARSALLLSVFCVSMLAIFCAAVSAMFSQCSAKGTAFFFLKRVYFRALNSIKAVKVCLWVCQLNLNGCT